MYREPSEIGTLWFVRTIGWLFYTRFQVCYIDNAEIQVNDKSEKSENSQKKKKK